MECYWRIQFTDHNNTNRFIYIFDVAIAVSYIPKINWSAKFAFGNTNLFIGIGFFALYGTEPVQKYFAMPLYLFYGVLFLYESWHSRSDVLQKPNILQTVLLALYFLYPFVSVLLGNSFPQMTTYIMPCPCSKFKYNCLCRIQK